MGNQVDFWKSRTLNILQLMKLKSLKTD